MAELPDVGADRNVWGDLLREFLLVAHEADGDLLASAVLSALMTSTNTLPFRFVNHGATAGTARPNATIVYWYGSVEPTNSLAYDLWYDTSP